MNKLINYVKLFFVLGLFLTALDCRFLPKNECELRESDGTGILGISVEQVDETDEFFGGPDKVGKDINFRGCGYVAKYKADRGNVYWMENKLSDIRFAKKFLDATNERLPESDNYKIEELAGIGEEAILSQYEHHGSRKLELAVRKGKIVFSILISKPVGEIPVEEVKSLAKRIADETAG